jgi:general secretion pathway protein D
VGGGGGGLGGLGGLGALGALGSGQQDSAAGTTGQPGVGAGQTGLNAGTGRGRGGGGLGGGAGGLGAGAAGALGGLGLGGLGGFTPIQYQDVGLTLRIKPQVNDSRYVRLEVDQEVSDLKGAGSDNLTPTQTRRNAKTTVLVKDQSTIVIGGLMRDVENKTVEKVPVLGDIPLVGMLFRKNSTITTKQNLVLMLTPYIIESEGDLQKIYERKLEERRELLKLLGRRGVQYMKQVNFDKKRGLLDRMRDEISESVQEKRAREEAREAFEDQGPRYRILGSDERQGGGGESGEAANQGEPSGETGGEPEPQSGDGGSSSGTTDSESGTTDSE